MLQHAISTGRLDRMAIGLSGLCLVHCVAGIFLVGLLGFGGTALLDPDIHRWGLVFALVIGAATIGIGALRTDDCHATYAALSARGVEFTEPPEERFYGVDASFRDPFGHHWRLTQPKELTEIREDVSR